MRRDLYMDPPFPRRRPFQRYNYGMNRRDYYEPGYYQSRGYSRGGFRGGRGRGRGGGRGQGREGRGGNRRKAEETKQVVEDKDVEKGSGDAKSDAADEQGD